MKIIDVHTYVGENLFGQSQSVDDLLFEMDRLHVDMAAIAPNRPKDYDLWPANQMVADAIMKHSDRFFGWARVDPWQGKKAQNHIIHAIEDIGLHGLLLHPWEENFQISSDLVDPLLDYAAQHRLPVLIEMGYPLVAHPMDLAELAHRHPDVTMVATHGLQLDSAAFALMDAEIVMRECDNIVMETSGMYAPEVMEKVLNELGTNRLIFGSHSPWLNQEFELERVRLLNSMSAHKSDVLGTNALRMFNRY
jgi:predicted TIM-barrel fold metal-dependent hydrolase